MNNMIGKQFYQVKYNLKNNGVRTKTDIFHKKVKIGYYKENNEEYPVYIECKINCIDLSTETVFRGDNNKIISIGNTKETVEHKTINKYYTLSFTGDSKYCSGQIREEIKRMFPGKFKELLEIWETWHLNDMQPNCIHQKAFDCNSDFVKKAKIETAKCPKKYRYGSKLLVKEIPIEIINRIISIFKHLNKI